MFERWEFLVRLLGATHQCDVHVPMAFPDGRRPQEISGAGWLPSLPGHDHRKTQARFQSTARRLNSGSARHPVQIPSDKRCYL